MNLDNCDQWYKHIPDSEMSWNAVIGGENVEDKIRWTYCSVLLNSLSFFKVTH